MEYLGIPSLLPTKGDPRPPRHRSASSAPCPAAARAQTPLLPRNMRVPPTRRAAAAHAGTAEGMRRAALAGVETIEHGDGGTPEVFRLMKERGVAFCPTLSVAGPSSARKLQGGARSRGNDRERERRGSVRARHNAREIELLV